MVKLAEAMVDMQRSFGLAKTEAEVGPFQTASPKVITRIQRDFGYVR